MNIIDKTPPTKILNLEKRFAFQYPEKSIEKRLDWPFLSL